MQVKINNKNYVVPELGFKHMTKLEDMGFVMDEVLRKNKSFSLVAGFVAIVVDCDRGQAENLCEQHILGGGSFENIQTTFIEAMEQSAFFRKLLGLEEKQAKTKKTEQLKIVDQVEE